MDLQDTLNLELANLVRISWVLLIPLGLLLVAILYKTTLLLNELLQSMILIRYEVTPIVKEVRLMAENMETLSAKALQTVDSVEKGVHSGVNAISSTGKQIQESSRSFFGSLMGNITNVLERKK